MGLIAVNIIGLIMFILAIVMFVLADSMVGIAIGVVISVVWLTFTITANVHILKGRRSTEKLKDSARGHLFDAQINMDSAIGFIQTYDYYTRPQPVYLDNLCRQGDELVRKFNILVEKMVDIDTNLSSLDMKYVDDVIECMNGMRQDVHSQGM